MPSQKRWITPDETPIPDDFQSAIGGHPLVANTLYRRGYRTAESAQSFLNPDHYEPSHANSLPDMQNACDLLADTIQKKQHILLWGDFDVDGQTSTTTLVEGLRYLGAQVSYHIPVRGEESHGIHRETLSALLEAGFDLLLTCDTGISEHENIRFLRDAGIPVIVTDHHTLSQTLPPANAVINPQRLPPGHPLSTLPGVGVTFKLLEALFATLNQPFEAGRFLELAALGIVADVAELQGDTRYLLQKGLDHLRRTERVGLQTLYRNANLNPLHLNEDHIGFQIAPRLNAVGRLGDANPMVELLTTEDPGRARVLANQIEAFNAKRRFATRQVEKAAESQLQSSSEDRYTSAIVLHHPNWPGGVVGIVASRLVERYQKPVILLTGEDPIHGSARSVEGINITRVIKTQADLLTGYGGHPMAAGLSFPAKNFAAVKRGILAEVEERARQIDLVPTIQINQNLRLDEITFDLIAQIERLAPFGAGNPPLTFMIQNLSVVSSAGIGAQGEHRQVIAADQDENQQRFIWWNGGDEPLPEAQFDLVCTLSQTDYKGSPQISAEWIDFRLSEIGREEVSRRHFEILDHRNSLTPLHLLQTLQEQNPDASIWAEGLFQSDISGLGRHELSSTSTLIIWTAPPSQSVLREAIRTASPKTLVAFGLDPNLDDVKTFMTRLAGLAKYIIKYKQGEATQSHLAAACAAERETVQVGLQLWAAKGKLNVEFFEDSIKISRTDSPPDSSTAEIFETILLELLAESRAYRQYFNKGALENILSEIYLVQPNSLSAQKRL